jgi:hypothetical protein
VARVRRPQRFDAFLCLSCVQSSVR